MKTMHTCIVALAVVSTVLTGCSTEGAAEDDVAGAHTEGLSDVHEPEQQRDGGEVDEVHNSAEPAPAPETSAEPESATSSTEPSQHWLAPPPSPAAAQTDPEAWADYKYTEWLHGMNTTYREMCGELIDLTVYRDCVPDDPHAYITDFSATKIGELVITIGPGPWEGGTYDTETIPAADFVAGNAPFKIARFSTDFDAITAVTPDGESATVPFDPALETYFDNVALEDMVAG